ncbi:MAG TPA: hypothetical protein VNA25_04755 [Phycisphaerae bacterium]|nr:hypothetical protein [Phycisphaerae bacterium]
MTRPADIGVLVRAITTPSTAEQLSTTSIYAVAVAFMAKRVARDNEGNVFVGTSLLDGGVAEQMELEPGDYWEVPIPAGRSVDLADFYIDADTAADGVICLYWR